MNSNCLEIAKNKINFRLLFFQFTVVFKIKLGSFEYFYSNF
jgi:hypothetical protein